MAWIHQEKHNNHDETEYNKSCANFIGYTAAWLISHQGPTPMRLLLLINELSVSDIFLNIKWASCQIRKIAGCACTGNAWNVFPATDLKPLVSNPGIHHGTCVTHVSWCMSGSLTHGGGENVPGIPGACTTRNITFWLEAHTVDNPQLVDTWSMGFHEYIQNMPHTIHVHLWLLCCMKYLAVYVRVISGVCYISHRHHIIVCINFQCTTGIITVYLHICTTLLINVIMTWHDFLFVFLFFVWCFLCFVLFLFCFCFQAYDCKNVTYVVSFLSICVLEYYVYDVDIKGTDE